jgi:endonuclease IV
MRWLQSNQREQTQKRRCGSSYRQGWADPIPRPDAEAFAEGRLRLGLSPVVAHAKYLINLASPDDELRGLSAKALAQVLVAAGGARG